MNKCRTSSKEPLEWQIQSGILKWLRYQKDVYAIRVNPVGIPLHNGKYRPSGMKGVSDIICCVRGKFLAIEVKRNNRSKVTNEQVLFLKSIKQTGGYAIVATNLDDVIRVVERIRNAVS
jgi:hypothetical protein